MFLLPVMMNSNRFVLSSFYYCEAIGRFYPLYLLAFWQFSVLFGSLLLPQLTSDEIKEVQMKMMIKQMIRLQSFDNCMRFVVDSHFFFLLADAVLMVVMPVTNSPFFQRFQTKTFILLFFAYSICQYNRDLLEEAMQVGLQSKDVGSRFYCRTRKQYTRVRKVPYYSTTTSSSTASESVLCIIKYCNEYYSSIEFVVDSINIRCSNGFC